MAASLDYIVFCIVCWIRNTVVFSACYIFPLVLPFSLHLLCIYYFLLYHFILIYPRFGIVLYVIFKIFSESKAIRVTKMRDIRVQLRIISFMIIVSTENLSFLLISFDLFLVVCCLGASFWIPASDTVFPRTSLGDLLLFYLFSFRQVIFRTRI